MKNLVHVTSLVFCLLVLSIFSSFGSTSAFAASSPGNTHAQVVHPAALCTTGGQTLASVTITGAGLKLATVTLMWSGTCGTNWTIVRSLQGLHGLLAEISIVASHSPFILDPTECTPSSCNLANGTLWTSPPVYAPTSDTDATGVIDFHGTDYTCSLIQDGSSLSTNCGAI